MSFYKQVKSSNIKEVGYNKQTKELVVKFKGNSIYVYKNVPNIQYKKLLKANSKGAFLNKAIKGKYPYKSVKKYEETKESKGITRVHKLISGGDAHILTREDSVKGGSRSTPKKIYAARLRELKKKLNKKKKGVGDELETRMISLMEDPESSILDLRIYAETIKQGLTNQKDKIALMRSITELHKAHFGTKVRNENLNLNMNVDITQPMSEHQEQDLMAFIQERRSIRK